MILSLLGGDKITMTAYRFMGGLMTALLPLALVPVAGAQEPASQVRSVDLGGMTMEVPDAWKEAKTTSSMRRLQLAIPKAQGDPEDGELAVFVFPGGAGTVQANVERWRNQFKDETGQPPKGESKTVKGKNVEVTRVALSGTFTDPFAGKGAQANYGLLGAIVETAQGAYFIKLVGPAGTLKAAEADFDKMIASMQTKG
jgi:hypothetical protein